MIVIIGVVMFSTNLGWILFFCSGSTVIFAGIPLWLSVQRKGVTYGIEGADFVVSRKAEVLVRIPRADIVEMARFREGVLIRYRLDGRIRKYSVFSTDERLYSTLAALPPAPNGPCCGSSVKGESK
jgi:hypothetical protein